MTDLILVVDGPGDPLIVDVAAPEARHVLTFQFRDSLVGNAKELIDLLAQINRTKGPKLDELTDRMRAERLRYKPDELRQDQGARWRTFNAAKDIKQDALDFFSGAFA